MGEHAERSYAERLMVAEALLAPLNRAAVAALDLPPGTIGLDAGCGIGLQGLLLAEAVGETGRVVGVDLQPALLAEARARADAAGMSGRVRFARGDVRRLPFATGEFDWAWSANCVGYGMADPQDAVAELARVVRPGGVVALLVWSSQVVLPGYPLLEARLNATGPGLAPFTAGSPPEWHHLRGLGLLRAAGLRQAQALTFAGQACAPLTEGVRAGLADLLQMRWPGAEASLSAPDAADFRRFCRPESPEFILDHPDYYALYTETLFRGHVADGEPQGSLRDAERLGRFRPACLGVGRWPVPADIDGEADRLSTALRALAPVPVDPSPIIRTALPFYGASLGGMEALARTWHREHAAVPAAEVLALADALWERAVREEMVLAAMLLERRPAARDAVGLRRLDRWGALLDNWETTDNLGGRVVGPWVAADPEARLGTLERLAGRRNPWLRRLALVGCVSLGRHPDAAVWWPRVTGIILALAGSREAAIPKAISWVLRAHTGRCPGEVAVFIREQGALLPAVAVREARNKLATGYKSGKPPRRAPPP